MQPKRQGRRRSPAKPKVCRFCEAKVTYIDFKDAETLSKFQTEKGKIMPRSDHRDLPRPPEDARHRRAARPHHRSRVLIPEGGRMAWLT